MGLFNVTLFFAVLSIFLLIPGHPRLIVVLLPLSSLSPALLVLLLPAPLFLLFVVVGGRFAILLPRDLLLLLVVVLTPLFSLRLVFLFRFLPLHRLFLGLLLLIVFRIYPRRLEVFCLSFLSLFLLLFGDVVVERFPVFFNPELFIIIDWYSDNPFAGNLLFRTRELGHIRMLKKLFNWRTQLRVEQQAFTDHV